MTDLRRKSRTILTLEKLEYNVPLKEEDFTLQALRNPVVMALAASARVRVAADAQDFTYRGFGEVQFGGSIRRRPGRMMTVVAVEGRVRFEPAYRARSWLTLSGSIRRSTRQSSSTSSESGGSMFAIAAFSGRLFRCATRSPRCDVVARR